MRKDIHTDLYQSHEEDENTLIFMKTGCDLVNKAPPGMI